MDEVRNKKSPIDLPFVGTTGRKEILSFWTMSADGDYHNGTRAGSAMAAAYIAYLATAGELPPILPQIVMDMLSSTALSDALQGQIVGFFSALEHRLAPQGRNRAGQI